MATDPFAAFRVADAGTSDSYVDALSAPLLPCVTGDGVAEKPQKTAALHALPPLPVQNSRREAWLQRAAEIEAELVVPATWAEALASLEMMPIPTRLGVTTERWAEVLGDARRFIAREGEHVAKVGWSIVDAFGFGPEGGSLDVGFVFLIRSGKPVVDDEGGAAIKRADGSWHWFRPGRCGPDLKPIWVAAKAEKLAENQAKRRKS
jgi:hypothetical protein